MTKSNHDILRSLRFSLSEKIALRLIEFLLLRFCTVSLQLHSLLNGYTANFKKSFQVQPILFCLLILDKIS